MIDTTWSELSSYLFTFKKLDESGARVYRGRFNILASYFAERDYTLDQVLHFFEHLQKNLKYTPGTCNNYIKLIRHVNSHLLQKKRLDEDFMSQFTYFKVTDPAIIPYTPEELERLITEAYGISYMLGVMTETFYMTGMRNSELYKLTWDDYEGERFILRHTKDGDVQYVYIPKPLQDKLAKLPRYSHNHIFGNHKRPIYQQYVNVLLQKAAKRANIPGHTHAHRLRHTIATFAARSTKNSFKVKEFMRHKNIVTTQRYVHLTLQDSKDVLQSVIPEIVSEEHVRSRVQDIHEFVTKTRFTSYMIDDKNKIHLIIDFKK